MLAWTISGNPSQILPENVDSGSVPKLKPTNKKASPSPEHGNCPITYIWSSNLTMYLLTCGCHFKKVQLFMSFIETGKYEESADNSASKPGRGKSTCHTHGSRKTKVAQTHDNPESRAEEDITEGTHSIFMFHRYCEFFILVILAPLTYTSISEMQSR